MHTPLHTQAAAGQADLRQERVRSTFTFVGIVLKDVGVRQAGGTFNAFVPLEGKPTLSVKFDDFVEGQELHGL